MLPGKSKGKSKSSNPTNNGHTNGYNHLHSTCESTVRTVQVPVHTCHDGKTILGKRWGNYKLLDDIVQFTQVPCASISKSSSGTSTGTALVALETRISMSIEMVLDGSSARGSHVGY